MVRRDYFFDNVLSTYFIKEKLEFYKSSSMNWRGASKLDEDPHTKPGGTIRNIINLFAKKKEI